MNDAADRGSWWRAVFFGAGAGILPVILVVTTTLIWAQLRDPKPLEAQVMLMRLGLVLGLGGGALLALAAGWWAGRKARRAPMGHGAVAGGTAAAAGIVIALALGGPITAPLLIAWLIRPPAGALGGWWAGR